MLFYVALTVAGIVAAAVIVWVFRSFMTVSKTAFGSISPIRGGEAKFVHLNSNLAATPAPWGWGKNRGNPTTARHNRHRATTETASRSKSRDFSGLEAYAKSNEKMARERDATSPHVGSVRNVLTGYDMQRGTRTDTSSWPYQDSLAGASSVPEDSPTLTQKNERPTKPWGW